MATTYHKLGIDILNPNAPENMRVYAISLLNNRKAVLCTYKYNFHKNKPKAIRYFWDNILINKVQVVPVNFRETITGTYYWCPECKVLVDLEKAIYPKHPEFEHYPPMKTCPGCGVILYSFYERKAERDINNYNGKI